MNLSNSKIRDRFLIADPGLFRLRSAVRGTITVLLSTAVLWDLSESGHRPFLLALVGALLAMTGAMLSDARTIREQKITALLIPPFAAVSLVLGVLLSPWHSVVLVMLLVFTFGAVYVRQFGARWASLGGMAYTAFFSSIFFKVPTEQASFVVLGILIAGVFSYAVKFFIVPDRANSAIRWSLSAYRAGLRRFVYEARRELRHPLKLNREALRPRVVSVNELALLSEDSILNASDSLPGSGALVRLLQGQVFELELTVRKIFESFELRPIEQTLSDLMNLEKGFGVLKAHAAPAEEEEEAANLASPISATALSAKVRYTPLVGRRNDFSALFLASRSV